jgi:hypothetical protein
MRLALGGAALARGSIQNLDAPRLAGAPRWRARLDRRAWRSEAPRWRVARFRASMRRAGRCSLRWLRRAGALLGAPRWGVARCAALVAPRWASLVRRAGRAWRSDAPRWGVRFRASMLCRVARYAGVARLRVSMLWHVARCAALVAPCWQLLCSGLDAPRWRVLRFSPNAALARVLGREFTTRL